MEKNEKFAAPIPDEKIEQVTGGESVSGAGKYEHIGAIMGSDGKVYMAFDGYIKRSCHLYKCKFCACEGTGNHMPYCRSSEEYRDTCSTCTNGDRRENCVACRARLAID